jgi:hypothetical protein
MPSIVVIEAQDAPQFAIDSRAVLTKRGFREVSNCTYLGDESAQEVVDELKTLTSYIQGEGAMSIKIHSGLVSRT